MNKKDLKNTFEKAKLLGVDVIVELTVPTRSESEYIVVLNDNIDYKSNYYIENYNDNLELNRCTDIKILNLHIADFKKMLEMLS